LLAAIALTVATGILIKMGKLRSAWVTALPLAWLAVVCTTAAATKVFSPNPEIGFWSGANALAAKLADGTIAAEKVGETWSQIIAFRIDAALALLFAVLLWIVIADMLRTAYRVVQGKPVLPLTEAAYRSTQLSPAAATAHG
jgi:carbon starvation protein